MTHVHLATLLALAVMVAPVAGADKPAEKLPDGAIARLGASYFFHPTSIGALSYSPDGATIATGTQDGSIFIWDVASGTERACWKHDNSYVIAVRFSPDGKLIASVSSNGVLHVWTPAGRQVFSRPAPLIEPLHFDWFNDGRIAFATRTTGVTIYDITAGREVKNFASNMTDMSNMTGLAASPDGKRIVLRDMQVKMKCFDVTAGRELFAFEELPSGQRYFNPLSVLRFTPDGKAVIADPRASPNTGPTLWDSATGKVLRQIDSGAPGYFWALSPNGRFLAGSTQGEGRLRVVGLASGLEVRSMVVTQPMSGGLTFSPDGKRIVAPVGGGQSLRVWDLASGEELHKNTGHGGVVNGLAFLADGRLLSTGADRTLRAWDVRLGRETERASHSRHMYNMVREPGGASVMMVAGNAFFRWQPGDDVSEVFTSRDGGNAVLAPDARSGMVHSGPQLKIFELPEVKEQPFIARSAANHIQNAALSPGGRWLAFVESDNYATIHVRDLAQGRDHRPMVGDARNQLYSEKLLFSPDGRFFTSVWAGRATLVWEASTGLLRATLPRPEPTATYSVTFSPDGRYLTMSLQSGAFYIHDLRTLRIAGPITGHRAGVHQLAYSVDGALLASGGRDSGILVWDVAKLLEEAPSAKPIIPPTKPQLDAWWLGLASVDGKAATDAVWSLAESPEAALALFRAKLKPMIGPDAAQIAQWVIDLGDAKYATREQAQRRLVALGAAARRALIDGQRANPNAEARTRIAKLLDTLLSPIAPEYLRPLRALEVLEKIGTPAAREQIEKLARESTDEDLRVEVRGVLGRWKK